MKRLSYYKPGESHLFASPEDLIEYAREYYSSDFRNSERVGCPDPWMVIELLESGKLPGEDLRSHLFSCSECFLCYREAQLKLKTLSNQQPASWWGAALPSLWLKPALIAASFLISALVAADLFIIRWQKEYQAPGIVEQGSEPQASRPAAPGADDGVPDGAHNQTGIKGLPDQSSKNSRSATGESLRATQREAYVRIDLRTGVLRGQAAPAPQEGEPKELRPSRTSFLFTLPEGSLKGTYQVSIVDAFGKHVVSGKAVSPTGKTLKISLNLSGLAEQRYRLCVSRAREIPDCYPVTIVNKE